MRDFLIAGNWKMNGSTTSNAELTSGIIAGLPTAANVVLLICPPFPYLGALAHK
jgi:triosephosphate isomerase